MPDFFCVLYLSLFVSVLRFGTKHLKIFCGCAPPLFWLQKYNSRFGEHFHDGQQYSLVSFLFDVLLLMVLPWPAICKSGGTHASLFPVSYRVSPMLINIQLLWICIVFDRKSSLSHIRPI